MKLSENFTMDELTYTATGLDNQPGEAAEEKLLYLVAFLLQPVRDRCGRLRVSSGYRSPAVNQRVRGSDASQHLLGEAADIIPIDEAKATVYRWIVEDSRLAFGQCIYEIRPTGDWIHISLPRTNKPNHEALVSPRPGKYIKYLGKL